MNRSTLALLVALVVLVLCGCQPALDTNRNLAAATSAPAKEAFDPVAIEAELIKLERDWADASKTHNAEAVKRVLADDAVIVYPDGTTATKADEIRTVESGAITVDAWELLDPKVTVLNADSAFITGRGVLKNAKYKLSNQKKPFDISGEYRFLDIYARRNGKWQAVASQTTRIDPAAAAAASPTASAPPPAAPSVSPAAKTSPTP